MRHASLVVAPGVAAIFITVLGCGTGPDVTTLGNESSLFCETCDPGGGGGEEPPPPPLCSSTCTSTSSCSTECTNSTGASVTCGAWGTCQRYDNYFAYTVITYSRVSRDSEGEWTGGASGYFGIYGNGPGGGLNMNAYPAPYPLTITQTSPASWVKDLGVRYWDQYDGCLYPNAFPNAYGCTGGAWKTPSLVTLRGGYFAGFTGPSAKWEFSGDPIDDSHYQGLTSTQWYPLTHKVGKRSVAAGSPPPTFGKKTIGILEYDDGGNPWDYVGSLQFDHGACKAVFDAGLTAAWAGGGSYGLEYTALASWNPAAYPGDPSMDASARRSVFSIDDEVDDCDYRGVFSNTCRVRYRVWCYKCPNLTSASSDCKAGITAGANGSGSNLSVYSYDTSPQ